MGVNPRSRKTFQFQGTSRPGGNAKFGGSTVTRLGGYGSGRGTQEARARKQKQDAFAALAKGRKGPAEIQGRAKGLFGKQVIDPEVEAARAGDVVAGAEKQALRKLQASRGAKTGDITQRGKLSIKRALKGTGERTMLKARGEAKQAADIANRQAQQDALRLEMGAQAQQSPFDMREADFISQQEFTTPDPRGGGFSFGGSSGGGSPSYGGILGASFGRPGAWPGYDSRDQDHSGLRPPKSSGGGVPPLLARPSGGGGQMGPPAPSRAAQNRRSWADAAARRRASRAAVPKAGAAAWRGARFEAAPSGMGPPAPQPSRQSQAKKAMGGWF